MLAELKKGYCETNLGAGIRGNSLKQVFWRILQKLKENNCAGVSFNKLAGLKHFFTGDFFRNLLELSMAFGSVKKI